MQKKFRILNVVETGLEKFEYSIFKNRELVTDFTELHDSEEEALNHAIKYNLSYFTIIPVYIKEI